jgi:biotin carboxylase
MALDILANEDMVVKEPQKPTAVNNTYWESRFNATDSMENSPKTKLPITFTIRTFTGNP